MQNIILELFCRTCLQTHISIRKNTKHLHIRKHSFKYICKTHTHKNYFSNLQTRVRGKSNLSFSPWVYQEPVLDLGANYLTFLSLSFLADKIDPIISSQCDSQGTKPSTAWCAINTNSLFLYELKKVLRYFLQQII